MRIAIFAKSTLVHGIGGMETHMENLCRELIARGHMVHVVTTRHPAGVTVEEKPGLQVRYLADVPARRYSQAWWRESRKALEALMNEGLPDFVLSQSLSAASLVHMARRPPVYPFIYNLMLSHLESEWHERNGICGAVRHIGMKLPEVAYYAFIHERPLLQKADAVFATCDQLTPLLENRCRRVFVSYNGVDVRRFAPNPEVREKVRKQLGMSGEDIVILLAGIMTRQKGMHLGIEALDRLGKRFPALRLLVVGGGPEEDPLKALAAESSLRERTHFVGGIPHHEVPGYFNAADIFLHPSLRAEGLPTVIAEAMASSLAVVATDAGGTKTAIADGETGILIPKGDVGSLTAAIEALVSDRSFATRLAAAGLERARERFAWRGIVNRLLADLGNTCGGK